MIVRTIKDTAGNSIDPYLINHNNIYRFDQEGRFHCDDGPAVIFANVYHCTARWYRHGVLHRVGGPAIDGICEGGGEEWRQNGLLHRLDGPARTDPINGIQTWWIEGKQISSFSLLLEE